MKLEMRMLNLECQNSALQVTQIMLSFLFIWIKENLVKLGLVKAKTCHFQVLKNLSCFIICYY